MSCVGYPSPRYMFRLMTNGLFHICAYFLSSGNIRFIGTMGQKAALQKHRSSI